MGFSRQEYWSGLPCPPPGDFPDPGTEPVSPLAPALQVNSSLMSHQGNPGWASEGKSFHCLWILWGAWEFTMWWTGGQTLGGPPCPSCRPGPHYLLMGIFPGNHLSVRTVKVLWVNTLNIRTVQSDQAIMFVSETLICSNALIYEGTNWTRCKFHLCRGIISSLENTRRRQKVTPRWTKPPRIIKHTHMATPQTPPATSGYHILSHLVSDNWYPPPFTITHSAMSRSQHPFQHLHPEANFTSFSRKRAVLIVVLMNSLGFPDAIVVKICRPMQEMQGMRGFFIFIFIFFY